MSVHQLTFQDAIDPSRFLRIVEEGQNRVKVKVFFGKDLKRLTYHGTTSLPKRLFFPDPKTKSRIGFNVL